MRKKTIGISITLCLIVMIIGIDKLFSQGIVKDSSQNLENATPIQDGIISEKQKAHSKLYKQYKGRRNIIEQVKLNRDFKIIVKSEPIPTSIEALSCQADVIVIGIVQNKISQLTEDKNFIFTDYDLIVEETWKDNAKSLLPQGTLITVTRPGGVISINGKVVVALDNAFSLFTVGEHYLLFLRYIPETNSYQAINSAGSFRVEGDKVSELRSNQITGFPNIETDKKNLKSKTESTVAACN